MMNQLQEYDAVVLYTDYDPERNPGWHEVARDIRTWARPEMVRRETLANAYRMVVDTTFEADLEELSRPNDDPVELTRLQRRTLVLEDVWRRMQGSNVDDNIAYHGAMCRSMCVGDIVVLDGEYWMADRVGFRELEHLADVDVQEMI